MRLLTWNVRYFGHATRGLRATTARLQAIAAALARSDADLVALQEVEGPSLRGGLGRGQADRLAEALHAAGSRRWTVLPFPAHRYAVGAVAVTAPGLLWLVREGLEVEDHGATEITHVRLPAAEAVKQRRIAAWIRLPGVTVVNTHLSLPAFLEVGLHRLPEAMGHGSNQAEEVHNLLSVVDRVAPGPAVVAGDLNSAPGSPAHGALLDAGFVDPWADDPVHTAGFGPRRMAIDHVLGRGVGLHDPSRWTVDDAGPYTGLSDHVPKAVRIGGPGASGG